MLSWFMSLAIHHKVMIIGFYLLGIILLFLWARFITKRFEPKTLLANKFSHGTEKCEKSSSRPYEDDNHQKPKCQFRICRLLSSCRHILKDKGVRYPTDNCGDQCKQPTHRVKSKNFRRVRVRIIFPLSQPHIRNIVARLRKVVNQSGKEPLAIISSGHCDIWSFLQRLPKRTQIPPS
jgi:hypothetical protein